LGFLNSIEHIEMVMSDAKEKKEDDILKSGGALAFLKYLRVAQYSRLPLLEGINIFFLFQRLTSLTLSPAWAVALG